jgi:hypothetical protein
MGICKDANCIVADSRFVYGYEHWVGVVKDTLPVGTSFAVTCRCWRVVTSRPAYKFLFFNVLLALADFFLVQVICGTSRH